jgi:hypothetical protein
MTKLHAEEKAKRIRQKAELQPDMKIALTWVAGHEGSIGNEAVDKLAKEAPEFESSNMDLLPPSLRRILHTSLSVVKSTTKRKMKRKCGGREANATKGLSPSIPHRNIPKPPRA